MPSPSPTPEPRATSTRGLLLALAAVGLVAVGLLLLFTPHRQPARAPSSTEPAPSRDELRLRVALELTTVDPTAAIVVLREVESPEALAGWAEAALDLLPPAPCSSRSDDGCGDQPPHERLPLPSPGRALAASPDGHAVVGTATGAGLLEAAGTSLIVAPSADVTTTIQAVALTPDAGWAAAAEPSGRVLVWRPGEREHHSAQARLEQVWALGLSPGGQRVAAGDRRGELRVWSRDAEGLRLEASLDVGQAMVRALAWLDADTLVVGDQSGRAWRWSAGRTSLEALGQEPAAPIAQLVPAPEPGGFVALHTDGKLRRWALGPHGLPEPVRRQQCSSDLLLAVAFVDDRLLGISRHGGVYGWPDPSSELCRPLALLPTGGIVVRAALVDHGRTVLALEAESPVLHRWRVDAFAADPARLLDRLWAATDECLTAARRVELLGDDPSTVGADLKRCRQRVAEAPALRP